jgi:hypothetical protein
MRFLRIAIGLCVLAAALPGATIDVTSQTTQTLQSGDSLAFLFTDSGYAQRAVAIGMAEHPSLLFFNFVSAQADAAGQFTARLVSLDGSVSALFPAAVVWSSGSVQMSGYYGPASVASGGLTLPAALSQQIFAGSSAELVLTYAGPGVTVGLPGYSLKHDLAISLAGGPLSIGAMDYSVTLAGGADSAAAAPEPDSAALIVTGVLLCAISTALKRRARTECHT